MHKFGHWQFDVSTGDLFDGQSSTRLEPQVAKLLDYFLHHQNELTSRDELITAVWENRIVSDDAINRCVSILRSQLTPNDKNAFIETVVRRGFISHFPDTPDGPDASNGSSSPEASGEHGQRAGFWNPRSIVLVAVLSAMVAVLYFQFAGNRQENPPGFSKLLNERPPVVAVLPFATFGQSGDSDFFASGVHDDLLTQMAQLQSLRVISRTSVLEYKDSEQNVREIGKQLGADAILEGSVQSSGDQMRINVQLIDAVTDAHLWAQSYDRQLSPENIFDVQTEIARSIAAALKTALTEQDTTQLKVLPTENMAAYRAYHRSMDIRDTAGVFDPAYLAALEEAVELDPAFVRAWAEMAGFLSLGNFSVQDPDSIKRIEEILNRIQTLAPQSADLLIAQGYYSYYILKDYKKAHQLITLAQSLRPSDERVIELKAHIERRMGDYPSRIASIRLAKSLDPRNPYWTKLLVRNLIFIHQYELAEMEIEQASIQDIELAELQLILNLQKDWDPDGWVASLESLQKEYGTSPNLRDIWDAHIAARQYAEAANVLAEVQDQYQNQALSDLAFTFNFTFFRIKSYWFLGASDQLDPLLARTRNQLEQQRNEEGEYPDAYQYLMMAYIYAVEGDREETSRLVRSWYRAASLDLATFNGNRHHACRALGLAAASSEAVECIRAGLSEPSFIMPFMEPNLPYYDAIRDTPEFIRLLAEIRQSRQ